MNAELLHAIADALYEDLQTTKQLDLLTELTEALKGQVDQPQQPDHQQRASSKLQEIQSALSTSAVNDFSPGWQERLNELGVEHLFGNTLAESLNQIFQRNQITVATAHEEVNALRQEVDVTRESLVFLIDGLSHFKIGKLDLESGEFEVGLLVPRTAVENELGEFASELAKLNKLLLPFSELATGGRPPFEIRSVSSSDFGVLLETYGPTAAAIAIAIERLTAWYKQLLEIRVLRQGLADQGVTDEELESVDAHADNHMERGIQEIVDDLLEEFGDDLTPERRNELDTELRLSLNGLANRIDDGYQIDVRSGPAPEEDEDKGEDEQDDPNARFAALIERLRPGLQFVRLTGAPILSLPEPVDDEED